MGYQSQVSESFPIVPSTTKTFVFVGFVLLCCLIPLLAIARLAFAAVPLLLLVGFVTLLTGAAIAYIGWSSRHVCFELSEGGLRIRNSMFGRFVPRADLLPEEGRTASIPEEPQLKPILRTFGSGLIGYCEGWFRLRNWDKALIFLTDRTSVVDLPTRRGYRLLLSVADPERFLADARRIWRSPAPAASPAPFRAVTLEPR
jgi:hypothetical protein